jgi:O-methyltransferase/aklanonic acid methyltransferase
VAADDPKSAVAATFDRAESTYDTVIPFLETFSQRLVETAGLQPGERVLDVASGRGACLREAARRVGPSQYVVAVDLSGRLVRESTADPRLSGRATIGTLSFCRR